MRTLVAGAAVVVAVGLVAPPAVAQEKETRRYAVRVDGADAGTATAVVTAHPDGATEVAAEAAVKVKVLLVTYEYGYRSAERWKGGRLLSFSSTAVEDGVSTRLEVAAAGDRLAVTAGRHRRAAPADAWAGTFWLLPPAVRAGRKGTIIHPDDGTPQPVECGRVGAEAVRAAGRDVACDRYRVKFGGDAHDLWYDAAGRLVRQEFVTDGFRTVVELTAAGR